MSHIIKNSDTLKVSVRNFRELFSAKEDYHIVIPEYQRPYVWTKEKVKELLTDLEEFFKKPDTLNYYMGTLLFHQDDAKKTLNIIDGQQRISTLLVVYYELYGKDEIKKEFNKISELKYNSPVSKRNLPNTQQTIKNYGTEFLKGVKNLFDRLEFTVIVTRSKDDAFTFFETSNNRGVKLGATDLLKAYHLRAIPNTHESLQESCALKWEKGQTLRNEQATSGEFAEILFRNFLWRIRAWRAKNTQKENSSRVLQEFQEYTQSAKKADQVTLYPNRANPGATKLQLVDEDNFKLTGGDALKVGKTPEYPFSLRQPLTKGLNFFLYAEKYARLIDRLFYQKTESNPDLKKLKVFYHQVYGNISPYLKEVFVMCITMYYDKFGTHDLLSFTNDLDCSLGAIRLNLHSIRRERIEKFFRDPDINLLDVIDQAYTPQQVKYFFDKYLNADDKYRKGFVEIRKGVRGNYVRNVVKYFGETPENIKKRYEWKL